MKKDWKIIFPTGKNRQRNDATNMSVSGLAKNSNEMENEA
jgi:hypothetical protein